MKECKILNILVIILIIYLVITCTIMLSVAAKSQLQLEQLLHKNVHCISVARTMNVIID